MGCAFWVLRLPFRGEKNTIRDEFENVNDHSGQFTDFFLSEHLPVISARLFERPVASHRVLQLILMTLAFRHSVPGVPKRIFPIDIVIGHGSLSIVPDYFGRSSFVAY